MAEVEQVASELQLVALEHEMSLSFGDEDLSDITLVCREFSWNVHRYNVCKKSWFLKHMWEQAPFSEGRKNVRLDDALDPPTVHRVLQHLYEDEYDDIVDFALPSAGHGEQLCITNGHDDTSADQDVVTSLLNNIRVYSLAEAFDLPSLLHSATDKITRNVEAACRLPEFSNIVEIAYASSDPIPHSGHGGLRDLFAAACAEHLTYFMELDEFKALMRRVPGLAPDILEKQQGDSHAAIDGRPYEEDVDKERHPFEETLANASGVLAELEKKNEEMEDKTRTLEENLENANAEIAELRKDNNEMQTLLKKLESVADAELEGAEWDLALNTENEPDNTTSVCQSITSARRYERLSFEELRLATYRQEKYVIKQNRDKYLPLDSKVEILLRQPKAMKSALERSTSDLKAERAKVAELRALYAELKRTSDEAAAGPSRTIDENKEQQMRSEIMQLREQNTKLQEQYIQLQDQEAKLREQYERIDKLGAILHERRNELREQYTKLKTKYEAVIAEPGNWQNCRNCGVIMNGHFAPDHYLEPDKITWRCNYCKCRHGDLASL